MIELAWTFGPIILAACFALAFAAFIVFVSAVIVGGRKSHDD